MRLSEIYKEKFNISFEVFPPKSEDKYKDLMAELEILKKYNSAFVSLTWGAGGNNNNSVELVKDILKCGYNIMPHFTCIQSSADFVKVHIKYLEELGIQNILALRGDIPEDKSLCCNDFRYANELVEFIKQNSDLSVGVAGYPEGHIEAISISEDIKNLKRKVNAGADAIFTQLFFDDDKFLNYTDLVKKSGIEIPVIAGIMPIISKKQVEKMTGLARITVPSKLAQKIEKFSEFPDDMRKFGIDYATEQCLHLIAEGVKGIHFYTLNKSASVKSILDNIL